MRKTNNKYPAIIILIRPDQEATNAFWLLARITFLLLQLQNKKYTKVYDIMDITNYAYSIQ